MTPEREQSSKKPLVRPSGDRLFGNQIRWAIYVVRSSWRAWRTTPEREQESAEVCGVCGREYAVWFAPSDTWNAVMRDGERGNADRVAFICPTCFTLDAEQHGIRPTAWIVSEENVEFSSLRGRVQPEREQEIRERALRAENDKLHDAYVEIRVQTEAELSALRGRVEQAEKALAEIAEKVHWQQVEWMHLHELAMSNPFGCEAEVQGFLRGVEVAARAAVSTAPEEQE